MVGANTFRFIWTWLRSGRTRYRHDAHISWEIHVSVVVSPTVISSANSNRLHLVPNGLKVGLCPSSFSIVQSLRFSFAYNTTEWTGEQGQSYNKATLSVRLVIGCQSQHTRKDELPTPSSHPTPHIHSCGLQFPARKSRMSSAGTEKNSVTYSKYR